MTLNVGLYVPNFYNLQILNFFSFFYFKLKHFFYYSYILSILSLNYIIALSYYFILVNSIVLYFSGKILLFFFHFFYQVFFLFYNQHKFFFLNLIFRSPPFLSLLQLNIWYRLYLPSYTFRDFFSLCIYFTLVLMIKNTFYKIILIWLFFLFFFLYRQIIFKYKLFFYLNFNFFISSY